jgi:PAS domain S-box-containing protein
MDTGLSFFGRRKDGTEFPVDISLARLETEEGDKTIAAVRDITRRAIAEEARRKSEQLFRGLLESAPDAMVIVDTSGIIQVVNAQTERLFGYTRAELRDQSVDVLLPERFRSDHVRHRISYLTKPQARPMGADLELYGRRKDATEFPVDISLSPMESESGTLVIAAVRDVTERHEARKKLDESFDIVQRQRLFARLIAAQEEERLRIASDIHDDTIQAMTATSLRMQQLRRHLTDPGQIELLSRLEDAVRESITRLRRLMFDLRPASLDRSGLASALRELLERWQEETHLTFTLENRLDGEPVGGIRTALYRIAQEALVNVKKHAAASTVNVEVRSVGAGCRVRIQDDGKGFDVEGAESKPGHLGLVSMHERAQIAGGWWLVRCPPGGGTVVEFWLPFDAETGPPTEAVAVHA